VVKLAVKSEKEKFLEKHPALSEEEIKDKLREAKKAKASYSRKTEEIEKNLLGYFDIEEPIINPETGEIIAWMKLPNNMLLEEYFGLTGGKTSPQELTKEEKENIKNKEYELMEQLITIPKKNKEWWKQHLNPMFSRLVRFKLLSFFEEIGGATENF